ncbi:hypothetical protein ERO13_D04G070350v2 [Gossypium hirsutum]|nr:hypothetical protein ERO13_D04G070350v2 [Gossypium hirsutum]
MNKTKKKWCHLPLSFLSPLFGKKGGMRFYFFSSSLFDLLENRLEEGLVSHAWRVKRWFELVRINFSSHSVE